MKSARKLSMLALGAVAAFGATALAQEIQQQYRDTRTGRMWEPQVIDEQAYAPETTADVDKAFEPRDQNVKMRGTVVQHPRATLMGNVPITAGPTVPLVTLDAPLLQVIPARHWLSLLYVTNNSAGPVAPVVGCQFTNHGRDVEITRVMIPTAGPGERLGVPVRGPRYDIFVDRVTCELLAPT